MKKLRLILKCVSPAWTSTLIETHTNSCLLRNSTCMSKAPQTEFLTSPPNLAPCAAIPILVVCSSLLRPKHWNYS